MPSFTRYYNTQKELVEVSIEEIETLIRNKKNQHKIAEYVYQRLYNRFLKIFDYKGDQEGIYNKNGTKVKKNIFEEEFKNGFVQLAACSLLIETFAAFLNGENETPTRQGSNKFNQVFKYAKEKNNPLREFENSGFYKKIRCGILHQGETTGQYTVTRKSDQLLNGKEINTFLFHKALKDLLKIYRDELKNVDWVDRKWDACRMKIQHIIDNTK